RKSGSRWWRTDVSRWSRQSEADAPRLTRRCTGRRVRRGVGHEGAELGVGDRYADYTLKALDDLDDVVHRQCDLVMEDMPAADDQRLYLQRLLVEQDALDLAELLVRLQPPDCGIF